MRAMILAAGRGTRLHPLTDQLPKPLIPISSEPLIIHQIRWLKHAGIREIVINLHHLGDQIAERLGTGRSLGVRLIYSRELELLDTGGGIVNALPRLGEDRFLVLNADVWTNFQFDFSSVPKQSLAHLILVPKPAIRKYGDFYLHDHVVGRPDKPAADTLVFSGISYLQPELFEGYQVKSFSLTRDLLFNKLDTGLVTGEIFHGTWLDVGTHDQLKALRRLVD